MAFAESDNALVDALSAFTKISKASNPFKGFPQCTEAPDWSDPLEQSIDLIQAQLEGMDEGSGVMARISYVVEGAEMEENAVNG